MRILACLFVFTLVSTSTFAQDGNPFAVYRDSLEDTSSPEEFHADTISQISPDNSNDTSNLDTIVSESSYVNKPNKNPFAVSHIPLKKSEVKTKDNSIESQKEKPINKSEKTEIDTSDKERDKISPNKSPKPSTSTSLLDNFVFWLLLLSLFLIGIIINLKRKTFVNMYRALTNDNYLKLLQREESNGTSLFYILLYGLFFINMTIFIYLCLDYWGFSKSKYQFFYILGGLMAIYFIRHLSLWILGRIFPFRKETSQYTFTISTFNAILGISLLPIEALVAFTNAQALFIYISISIIVVFYLFRQLRGIILAMRIRDFNLFHFFIYLCAFEIAPFVIIYGFFSRLHLDFF